MWPSSSADATRTSRSQNSARRMSCSACSRVTSRCSMTSQSYGDPTTFQPFSVRRSRTRAIPVSRCGVSVTYSRSHPECVCFPRPSRSTSSRNVPKTWIRTYVGAATSGSLATLLYEAVAAIGIFRDHHQSAVLEPGLTLESRADEVVMLVLGRHTGAPLALDLGVEAARTDAKRDALAGTWK